MVKSIRPGYGLAPKFEKKLLGRIVKDDVKRGTATNWGLINDE